MKKLLLTILVTLAAVSFRGQVMHWIKPEKKISKHINLRISTGKGYAADLYAGSVATLRFTVLKQEGGESTVLLRNHYPEFRLNRLFTGRQVFNQDILVAGVADSREQVYIAYTVTYSTNGRVLEVHNLLPVAKGTGADTLYIRI